MKAIRHFHFGEYTPPKQQRSAWFIRPSTVVVENCPTNESLRDLAIMQIKSGGAPMEFPLYVGIARLHPDDQYNKKKGVEIASKKAEKAQYYRPEITVVHDMSRVESLLTIRFVNTDPKSEIDSVTIAVNNKGTYPEIIAYSVKTPGKQVPW